MDPLSTLGIAAAVVQFVDFGQRLLSETWHVYRSATGETLELRELSTISQDLTQITVAVQGALNQQQRQSLSESSHDTDTLLLGVCGECDAIAQEINSILPHINDSFKKQLKVEGRVAKQLLFMKQKSTSIGEAFRTALRTLWKGKELEELRIRLSGVSQKIIMMTTISIWHATRDSRDWEKRFSDKLDAMIEALDSSVKETIDQGPWCGESEPSIEPRATESIRKGRVAEEIISRLWSKDWEPDPSILSTFPRNQSSSREEIQVSIGDSLKFDSMDSRQEAIVATYKSTYQWVFSQTPTLSDSGKPLWSSLPDWLEGNSQHPYWITGKPGAGKSTAMKYIINHPKTKYHLSLWARDFPIYNIKYYAWKLGQDLGKSEEGLLRTLLHQTLQNDPDLAPILCPRRWALFHTARELHPADLPLWSYWELHESFSRLLSSAKDRMRLIIFIDGLDEFNMAPLRLCSLIEDVAQNEAIKVCVASRSWPQFSDAFAHSPGMQMHLLTEGDIEAYVFDHFKGVRAFSELKSLYQNDGEQLLHELVSKSDGVFLWTSVVTQTIYQSLIEGASLSQLHSILDEMPPEIEDLYDAIYSTIPSRLLPEISAMLQIFISARKSVDCITLWLADETRGVRASFNIQDLDIDLVYASLERRLSARTRGILEAVKATKAVDFLHRTAAEWVTKPRVWEQLRLVSPMSFNPHMCLLHAEIIKMGNLRVENFLEGTSELWESIGISLLYASRASGSGAPEKPLIDTVDLLYETANTCFSPRSTSTNDGWTAYQLRVDLTKSSTHYDSIYGLAVQFAILPYVRRKFEEYPAGFDTKPLGEHTPLLSQAIFGRRARRQILAEADNSTISEALRLETIAYLLSKGVRQPGIASSMERCKSNSQYYSDVMNLLQSYNALEEEGKVSKREKFEEKMRKWLS